FVPTVVFPILFPAICIDTNKFHLVNDPKSYTEAKSFCRATYTGLATVRNSTDMDNLIALVPSNVKRAWIGLEIGDVWMWHWSLPDKGLDFLNWKAGEPQNTTQDKCGAMDHDGKWFESDCDTKRGFICNDHATGHIFIAEVKSWREAQNHCRNLSSDLVSIQSAEENQAVQNVTLSQTVWIGLFKDAWKWSDGSPVIISISFLLCFLPIDKLILVQENMTWSEALSYCREHHVDLVYVTTEEIQERVSEKVKNATSSHVWLGLRYSCSFKFWFWIRLDTGCYQNWAPGQGPDSQYDCGIMGAIESTGGQQWVGLPETEKLNFICVTCAETGDQGV
uniref:Si:dkey-83f18.10 n=1 Tax=Myripristis murdjan TaxID=586833 RepID=A0A667Y2S9_9TELE